MCSFADMKVHFIAMGGSIMHSLAIALHRQGHIVKGSDDQIYDPAKSKLAKEGLLPDKQGWFPEHIDGSLDAVILGMHAFKDNPELLKARELELPIYSFPEFIYKHSKNKHRIVIAGSYGKTTITSMVMHVLKECGKNFDYLVGANVPGFEVSVKLSEDAPTIILEGDEYLSSRLDPRPKFLLYQPHTLVVTGISWDHINVFPTENEYVHQFEDLIQSLDKGADIIFNKENDQISALVKSFGDPETMYFHEYGTPKYNIQDGVYYPKLNGVSTPVRVFGKHNMSNLEAAWKVCELMGVEIDSFLEALKSFEGPKLRQEKIFENEKVVLYRDYAHAPPKVEATVDAFRERFPKKNLIACFELHTFSSLNREFLKNYRNTLEKADTAIVFVNPATFSKRRMEPFNMKEIREAFLHKNLFFINSTPHLVEHIHAALRGNDAILLMSSGNFGQLDIEDLINTL